MTNKGPATDSMETRLTLVARVQDPADHTSWAEFVALYEPLLTRYVASRGLPESDTHDIVQNIFIKLLREVPKFRLDHDRGRFRTWLYQLTTTTLIDFIRQRKRQSKVAEELELLRRSEARASLDGSAEFANEHHRQVLSHVLERVKGQANPQHWECFAGTALSGRPASEVANALSIRISAVYVNSSRVLQKVREQCALYLEPLHEHALSR